MADKCENIRSPICTTLGHVDHGKSSILDVIRGSAIVATEAGAITQAIGASIVPIHTIQKRCGELLEALKMKLTIPGLLFIDTPGHAAFTSLRKRGGNLADIAILVVDVNEGFKPQTIEALEILKSSKTPFIIAANKIDIVQGFHDFKVPLIENIKRQNDQIQTALDTKIYELVGKLSEYGINSERYDRVEDFTKQIAIVPTSAKEDIGIPELLVMITGLAQRFLENCLVCNIAGEAKGIILEIKEEKGLGMTLDVILYDGTLKVNDTIVIGSLNEPIVTKVKALLEPAELAEIRDKKAKFKSCKCVTAATGVKISAPNIDEVIAGMPLQACGKDDIEAVKVAIQEEVEEVLIETDGEGIVIKADSLGSLEALILLLQEKEIPIKRASIGNISKKHIIEAQANLEKEPLHAVILGFNVEQEIKDTAGVHIITNQVVYKIIEDLEMWTEKETKKAQAASLDKLARPFKFRLLDGYVFRQSHPAVVGVEVMEGTLKSGIDIMNREGKTLTKVKGLQVDSKTVDKAERGKQAAVSMDHVTVGRQIHEGDVLFSAIPEEDFKKLKEHKKHLTPDEIETLKEIAAIKRIGNPVWGV